ncbi:ribonuclease T2 family protein [Benzoatithermus flavus]|uniref:Uncharacterized protein n=1 Tax=Benzoatithermus flavus TaxID=3108223 RepID=A0ABU8XVX1_9PROT
MRLPARLAGLLACIAVAAAPAARPAGAPAARYVLAVSWQPAFCELNERRPECRDQTGERPDATRFSLHGLWPEAGEYCGVDPDLRRRDRPESWQLLPEVALSAETRRALEALMPGTRSGLDRHEWLRHGTCYGASAEEYFRASIRLVQTLNESRVRDLFARRIGGRLTLAEIQKAFDDAFGRGTGERVGVVCEGKGADRLITELRLRLEGTIDEGATLAGLMASAPPARERCPSGKVDPAGRAAAAGPRRRPTRSSVRWRGRSPGDRGAAAQDRRRRTFPSAGSPGRSCSSSAPSRSACVRMTGPGGLHRAVSSRRAPSSKGGDPWRSRSPCSNISTSTTSPTTSWPTRAP